MIRKLTEFLMKCDDSKKIALYCSLDWLNNFIDFLREDFLMIIKQLQMRQSMQQNQEESKEQVPSDPPVVGQAANLAAIVANPVNNSILVSPNKRNVVLDLSAASLLRSLYKDEFPEIISTVLRLKHSKRIDPRCKQLVENMNGRFLRTVIQILVENEEFEFIFKRLMKEYNQDQQ